jgi:hypothetical protein
MRELGLQDCRTAGEDRHNAQGLRSSASAAHGPHVVSDSDADADGRQGLYTGMCIRMPCGRRTAAEDAVRCAGYEMRDA